MAPISDGTAAAMTMRALAPTRTRQSRAPSATARPAGHSAAGSPSDQPADEVAHPKSVGHRHASTCSHGKDRQCQHGGYDTHLGYKHGVSCWPPSVTPLMPRARRQPPRSDGTCAALARRMRSIPRAIERATPTGPIRNLAMLGSHVPRQCGIATFTADLSDAIAVAFPAIDCFVLAMNEAGSRHAYPPRVRFELDESDLASYRNAAELLNAGSADVVSVQHEYGIFGGDAGSHVLQLLKALRMPIVTTLHTVIAEPNPAQRAVMDELTRLSRRLVVMSARGAALLGEIHHVPNAKIDLIPHGIHTVPFA